MLEELFDDALGKMNHVLVQVGCVSVDEQQRRLPLCRFLRENRPYQPLFFSDSLRSYVIERIAAWDNFSARMRTQSGLEEETLRAIFFFQLNGCLAISKRNIDIPDENWAEIQCQVDRFLKNGLANL